VWASDSHRAERDRADARDLGCRKKPDRCAPDRAVSWYSRSFLLRPWARNGALWAYYDGAEEIVLKRVGPESSGMQRKQVYLLAERRNASLLDPHLTPRAVPVDDRAAKVRVAMLRNVRTLDAAQRTDFARLLLSLDARRPSTVARLKTEGASHLRGSLDVDGEVIAAMQAHGIDAKPSEYYEGKAGHSFEGSTPTNPG
jgi:hypothetical protein